MTEPIRNVEAERAVLGAVMTAPTTIDELTEILTPRDFYQPAHEAIWEAVLSVHARGQRPDQILVARELGANLARVGGAVYLSDLTAPEIAPVPAQAAHYAGIVANAALGRRIITATQQIQQRVETADDVRTAAEDARQMLDEATEQAANRSAGVVASDLLSVTIDSLEREVDNGIGTGWSDLDDEVNGLRPGQLAIIGARPSVGKSVIGANLAAAACKAGVGVHFASLEMTRDEVMKRLLSAHCTIDLSRLMNHKLNEDDWHRMRAKGGDVTGWPMWVDDQGGQTLMQLRSRARTSARRLRAPLGLIVVDYLQLMAPRTRGIPREQQVGELSEGLKALAKELRVPVVALAQVNRASAERTDRRPVMSDLRESGRIEADADHIWLLHRQDLVDPNSATGEIEVLIAKNRNGRSGATVRLNFSGHYSRADLRHWTPTKGIA